MLSSGMLRSVAPVRADVSEERITSYLADYPSDEGGDTFFRNVGSYRNHTA
jgi:hypothetical protein